MGPAPSTERRRGRPPPPSPYGPSPRASHAEREVFVDRLQAAYADGRLDKDEFERRVHRALTVPTHVELWALLGDLPGLHPVPPARSAVGRPSWAERGWAALGHLSGFLTSFVGPAVLAYTKGRRSGAIRYHALEAANFQLSFLAANILLLPISVVTLGLGLLLYIPLWLGWLVLPWLAGAVATAGEPFRYPSILRLLR
jgi:uncharacterized Tic20 family protein